MKIITGALSLALGTSTLAAGVAARVPPINPAPFSPFLGTEWCSTRYQQADGATDPNGPGKGGPVRGSTPLVELASKDSASSSPIARSNAAGMAYEVGTDRSPPFRAAVVLGTDRSLIPPVPALHETSGLAAKSQSPAPPSTPLTIFSRQSAIDAEADARCPHILLSHP